MIYDKLVKPPNLVVDYNTAFSGISASDLENVETTLAEVQQDLLKFIDQTTILVGQSLESDLKAVRVHFLFFKLRAFSY
jgi:RNA exonuclease 1